MAWNFPNATTPDGQIIQVVEQSPVIAGAMLSFIYLVVFMAVHFGHKRTGGGSSDILSSSVFAGVVTTISSIIMYLIDGLISIEIVYICMSVTIISILLLFLKDD